MILLDQMKNLKVYKVPMLMPTLENDKKKHSAILLLTPNYASSKSIIKHHMLVNRLRYQSYYFERDVSFYMSGKIATNQVQDENYIANATESDIVTAGLVTESKNYPNSVLLEDFIQFNGYNTDITKIYEAFNHLVYLDILSEMKGVYVNKTDDIPIIDIVADRSCNIDEVGIQYDVHEENCVSIIVNPSVSVSAIRKEITEAVIGQVRKDLRRTEDLLREYGEHAYFYHTFYDNGKQDINIVNESTLESANIDIRELDETSYITDGNTVILFESTNDVQLKKLLYNERLRKRSQVLEMLKTVKADIPEIKFAYPELDKYNSRNLFIDLHYYIEIFFKNTMWKGKRGFNLFLDFLTRLIQDPRIKSAGYKKKTLVIPINDWTNNSSTRMWLFKQSINPISILYQLMLTNDSRVKTVFSDCDILFLGSNILFRLNLNEIEAKDLKKAAITLSILVRKTLAREEFDIDEVDIEYSDNKKETKEVIRANIIDKIELAKGVDLTGKNVPATTKNNMPSDEIEAKKDMETKSLKADIDKQRDMEHDMQVISRAIDDAAEESNNTDEALDRMDDTEDIKSMLANLSVDGTESTDPARAARMNKLDKIFLDSEVKGRSVRDILASSEEEKPLEVTRLNISSPNEEWKNLTYMNFDKNYDLNRDIVASFYHFTRVSHPIGIRELEITDHTTSEDRLDLYTCHCEDALGQRFTIKLDIPRAKDNRFLLRGNDKSIKTQLLNMPILKTDLDTCQCISNYQKIMIERYNTSTGRTYPMAGRLIKALTKYEGKDIKVRLGDNTRVCNKYELPIDYIDMASAIDTIETKNYKIYFNQETIHEEYPEIDDSLGVPYAINKFKHEAVYFTSFSHGVSFCYELFYMLADESPDFKELVLQTKAPASGAYTRCSIMSSKIPMVVITGLLVGLTETLKRAKINYTLEQTKSRPKIEPGEDAGVIRFSDGWLKFDGSYDAYLLLNGLNDCSTELFSVTEIDSRNMYLEFLDNFGGRIKADGLYNFYDCFVDPITYENLKHYHLPTNFIDILLYSNVLLSDNKFVAHTNMASRRIRRTEMIAAYAYETLGLAYGIYAYQIRAHKTNPEFFVKQSAVIDKFLSSDISSDSSTLSALSAIETTNEITFKGKAGLNNSESYSLDKRLYDDSMLNVLGASTNFSANVGINRIASIDMNIEGERGYIKTINGDTSQFNTAKTLSATEAMTPFGTTRDDANRTNMTYIQTAKHMMRTEYADPLLVTNGFDQVVPYMTSDKFAFKAKQDGVVEKVTDEMVLVKYADGTHDYISLKEKVEKNSDGGFYVPLKLDKSKFIKEGYKLKKNDIIAYDSKSFSQGAGESDKLTYDIGKLAKIGIMNSDSGYDDAGICGESLSQKLASRVIKKMDITISKDADIMKFAKIGDEVKVNDPLVIWSDPHDEEDATALARALGSTAEEVSEFGRRSLKANTTGRIADIRLYRTNDIDEMSPSVQKIFKAYEKPISDLKKELVANGIETNELPADYKLELSGKLKKAKDAFFVEFFIEFLDTVAVGDKIVYFSANKAVIDAIIPKEKAPYTDFRPKEPVDAFVSVTSIDKRMVTSTLIYGGMQKLLVELDRSIKDILGIPYDETSV